MVAGAGAWGEGCELRSEREVCFTARVMVSPWRPSTFPMRRIIRTSRRGSWFRGRSAVRQSSFNELCGAGNVPISETAVAPFVGPRTSGSFSELRVSRACRRASRVYGARDQIRVSLVLLMAVGLTVDGVIKGYQVR
jgi:hypothetical protein